MRETLRLDRAIIVQPSVYGTDNLTTMKHCVQDGSMKAVVVVDDRVELSALQALSDQGAVGARVNMLFSSNAQLDSLSDLTHRMAELGWHLQVLADVSDLPDLEGLVANLPVPVVFDHMGHVPAPKGVADPGFQTLLSLMDSGQVWVKLSGAYRVDPHDIQGASPMAQALIAANPERLVWGTDWPHPSLKGPMPDDGDLLDALFDWAGEDTVHRILVENPEQLYGFLPWGTI